MDDAKSGVAIFHGIGDDADGEKVVNLVDGALLLLTLQVQGVEALDASLDFGGNAGFDHFVANGILDFVEKFVEDFLFGGELFLQL